MENKVTILDQSFDFGPKIQFYNFVVSQKVKEFFKDFFPVYFDHLLICKGKSIARFQSCFQRINQIQIQDIMLQRSKRDSPISIGANLGNFFTLLEVDWINLQ